MQLDDAIAALASAAGPAASGIIRVSGPTVREVLNQTFVPDNAQLWEGAQSAACHPGIYRISLAARPSGQVSHHGRVSPEYGCEGLNLETRVRVYLWPNSSSYTGQPMAELHTPGSPPLLEAVLSTLFEHGVRPARPGEFTLRAFLAGRIDLVQAEAVLGVIEAFDHQELEQALQQLAGGLSQRLMAVRNDIIDLVGELEAGLDFAEEDIEFVTQAELATRIQQAVCLLQALLDQSSSRMQSTGRSRVVLAGLPNAGKSTLFNALCGRPAALVSELQGTTRDYLKAQLDWDAISIDLIDTAGWEQETGDIGGRAQEFRDNQIARADLIVWCTGCDLDAASSAFEGSLHKKLQQRSISVVRVQTKADLRQERESQNADQQTGRAVEHLTISALTGEGLSELIQRVSRQLAIGHRGNRQMLGTTASRCRDSLTGSIQALHQASQVVEQALGEELVVVELREALQHLGRILGDVFTDDILDRIFSKFCIGK